MKQIKKSRIENSNNKLMEDYLNTIGKRGDTERLKAISYMNLGTRSEAARRVLDRRFKRLELMSKGFSHKESVIVVNNHKQQNKS